MGYTTDFKGELILDKPLANEHRVYLEKFASTRRMTRDVSKLCESEESQTIREAAGLPVGEDGCFVLGSGTRGSMYDLSVSSYNQPPAGQPSLWCQWVPDSDGECIVWDEGEKFYHYIEWMEYLIETFLKPWGYVANGCIYWQGQDVFDIGRIVVTNNVVERQVAKVTYEQED